MANAAMTKAQDEKDPVREMKGWINSATGAFAKILPKHVTPERFVRVAHAAITKTPRLADCDPMSVVMALIHCSELGLEPNTPLQHAYLIPYRNRVEVNGRWVDRMECQLQIGYRGLLHLARQSGELASVSCHVVYEGDEFDLEQGDTERIVHRPTLTGKRGRVIGAYMVAKLADGAVQREWMSSDDLEAVRVRSTAKKSPWGNPADHPEMCRKTVFKRGSKWLPMATDKSDALARAVDIDNRYETKGRAALAPELASAISDELPKELRGVASQRDDEEDEQPEDTTPPEAKSSQAGLDAIKGQLSQGAKVPVVTTAQETLVESQAQQQTKQRAPRRTPEEARAESAQTSAELHAEIEALQTLEECDEWPHLDTVKARRGKLTPEARQRVDAAHAARKASFEPPPEPGSNG